MYDLMYCGEHQEEIHNLIIESFPNVKIEDASDEIHRGRFSVEVECERNDWMLWLMRQGVHEMSFDWQITIIEDIEYLRPLIHQVVEEQK